MNSKKKRVSLNIFQVSLLVSICASGIIFSQPKTSAPQDNRASEHIWSIEGETMDFARDSIKNLPNTPIEAPEFYDRQTTEFDDPEWLKSWEWSLSDEGFDDIDTFFPVADNTASNTPEKPAVPARKPTPIPQSAFPPAKQQSPLFPLGKTEESPLKNAVAPLIGDPSNSLWFYDEASNEWVHTQFTPRPSKEISSARGTQANVIAKEEKVENPPHFAQAQTSSEETAPASAIPSLLGQEKVAVDPFVKPYTTSKKHVPSSQVISAQKAPYLKPEAKRQLQGLSGPYQPKGKEEPKRDASPADAIAEVKGTTTPPKRHPEGIVAQIDTNDLPTGSGQLKTPPKTILINFNNVSIIEYIRFVSRLTNKNFVFDEQDLQFNVTIISEEPTTLENVMTALIQELRIHGLKLIEEDNNLIIHKSKEVNAISRVSVNSVPPESPRESELITQVFRLNTLDPARAKRIITPLLSKNSLIEVSETTRQIIITDLVVNITQVDNLLKSLDAPNSGLVIGQYVVRNAFMDTLIELAKQIMVPIAEDQPLSFIQHPAAKSIFIVSSPFIVERTISVLQHLDNFEGTTKIFDLDELKFSPLPPTEAPPETLPEGAIPSIEVPTTPITPIPGVPLPGAEQPPPPAPPTEGRWELTPQGKWIFRPGISGKPGELPQGQWLTDPQNNWYFVPKGSKPPFARDGSPLKPGEAPKGRWVLDPQGSWVFQMAPAQEIKPESLARKPVVTEELPVGHIERTKFLIHKLEYRKGEDIVEALQKISESLMCQGQTNQDLALTVGCAQWLEASNSIIITGTEVSIEKVRMLIEEMDRPLRQVFIEMLILETSLDDSLTYGVSWATRSGGGSTATAQAFLGGASPLAGALAGTGIIDGEVVKPDASTLATTNGYNLGIIGQRLTHNGTQFATLGALVTAIHQRGDTEVILNPKIITEDNKPAEIFVGINTRFQTQAVSNDEGSIITNNFEFRDVGTTLRVTPMIGRTDIITLEIEQEVSRVSDSGGGQAEGEATSDLSPGPTTSINRTSTTVHIPDKHFVVISGMIQDEKIRSRNQFPCLGGIPVLGAAFSAKTKSDAKRNLMIFIRPEIIDTAEEFRDITRRQQEIYKQKKRMKKSWKYEVDEALDFMNIKPPCCDECP